MIGSFYSRAIPGLAFGGRAFLAAALLPAGLLAASPALADVEKGIEAWARGDYAAAVSEWRDLAAQGDADAQFNLGQAYKLGHGVEQDLAKAEELFGKAAEQGHMQAADNYGLLLFQRGDHAHALPYILAASDRGDPRANYVLGLAYFNGDSVPKDWVMAYALVSLAHQSGMPQATEALAQMDKYVPLELRQKSVPLASRLATQAEANRAREVAAVDLGTDIPLRTAAPRNTSRAPDAASLPSALATPATAAPVATPAPPAPAPVALASPQPAPAKPAPTQPPPAKPAPAPAKTPAVTTPAVTTPTAPTTATPAATGPWRVQLGAFAVPGNAEGLWKRLKNRPELAGHAPLFIKTGRFTLLQAGGFASRGQAQAACSRLAAVGFDCVPSGK